MVTSHGEMRIERFHSRGQQPCKFIGTKESFYIRKEFNSHRIVLGHQHAGAAVSLFWDTNMAAVTSYENTLYNKITTNKEITKENHKDNQIFTVLFTKS